MYNLASSAARHLFVIFCRKNGSECSFSGSYPQDISCWRFEVALFFCRMYSLNESVVVRVRVRV